MRFPRTPASLAPNRFATGVARARAAGRPLIDLTESNPTRAGFLYPDDLLAPLADPRGLLYAPRALGLSSAREAVAADYARRGLPIRPERIVLTASTSEAYSLVFKLLTTAGDEVLIPRPSYPLFDHLTRLDLVTARPYDLEYHGAWSIDFSSLEQAITPRTRVILVVSPNNPTGSFVTGAELERLAGICRAHELVLVADEVFADYTLGDEPAGPSVAGRTDVLTVALGGLSKSIGLPQAKLGWMVVSGPDGAVDEVLDGLELVCDTYLSVSTPVQVACPALLERGAAVREAIIERIRRNDEALRRVARDVPACTVLRAEGGWYAVVQVPTFRPEEDLVLALLEQDEVIVHPGYFFDLPRESYLIVSLLPSPARFDEGIRRMLARATRPPDRESSAAHE